MFVTGASKFVKAALFSGANNLIDISDDQIYNELYGLTCAEIERTFGEHIQQLADFYDTDESTIQCSIKALYTGYTRNNFPQECTIYNPWSITRLFAQIFQYKKTTVEPTNLLY